VKSFVLELTSRFDAAGIASGRINAETMLSNLLGCRIIDLYLNEVTLSREDADSLERMVSRRIDGEPLQHITGRVNFYGNDLIIREGVFIPRPETETLIDIVVKLVSKLQAGLESQKIRIFDLCTGSGNIGISLTKALTRCTITSSDISYKALELAAENAFLNSVSDEIEFIKADLFDIQEQYKGCFDIIASNPPYISSGQIKGLSKEVNKDPIEALDGGDDGISFYRRIVEDSPGFLKRGGSLVLELADEQSKDVKRLIEVAGCFNNIKLFRDLNNVERVIAAQFSGNQKPKTAL